MHYLPFTHNNINTGLLGYLWQIILNLFKDIGN